MKRAWIRCSRSWTKSPRALYDSVFDLWVQQRLASPTPALRRALARRYWDDSPLEPLRAAGWKLCEWRDFPAAWKEVQLDLRKEADELATAVMELAGIAEACQNPKDNLRRDLQPVVDFRMRVTRAEEVRARDYYSLESLLHALLRDLRKKGKRKGSDRYAPGVSREKVLKARDALVETLDDFRRRSEADFARAIREELRTLVDAYENAKRRAGKLDFLDLLLIARNMVRGNPDVRAFLQTKFTHILVDEFQDTDPLQAEILLLLSADDPAETNWIKVRPHPGKLFVVGDPKQSIYRFRRADVLLYEQVRRALNARGVRTVYLSRSFRAVEAIQRVVNAAFSQAIQENEVTGQPRYVPLAKYAESPSDRPSVIALPVPRPFGSWGYVTRMAIDESLPGAICGWVEWLLKDSGWKVRNHEGEYVAVRPRDVALLFRHLVKFRADCTREFVRGLEDRGIPHVLVSERSFFSREEVGTLRAALNAIEWPDDELSVFATLRGTFFGFTDEQLLRYRHATRSLHPFSRRPESMPEDLQPVAGALQLLAELHMRRNRKPIVDTLSELLARTRAAAAFVMRPAGQQVFGNVERVCEMARAFEMRGGLSFRSFVETLDEEADEEQSTGGALVEEAAEGVRIMSVHAAKGLEFPVVIPCDLSTRIARDDPERYVDPRSGLCAQELAGCRPQDLLDYAQLEHQRDEAEGVRIAYVAATRARDILVIPAVGVQRFDGWLSPLNAGIYPDDLMWQRAQPAPACPEFGNDSVLERPNKAETMSLPAVRPGLHVSSDGSEVVWWDPGKIQLKAPPRRGLHHEDVLYGPEEAKQESIERHYRWAAARQKRIESGAAPQFEIVLPSQTSSAPPAAFEVRVQLCEREMARPGGRGFGTLVHTVLSQTPLDAGEAQVRALAALHGRTLGSANEEVEAAVAAVRGALTDATLKQALAAQRVLREVPVTVALEGNRVLEAVIDLAFLDASGWHIVDFKSDADAEAAAAHYRRQLEWYAYAFSKVLAPPASVTLLYV